MKAASVLVLAVSITGLSGVASADITPPHQKAGLWQSTMTMMGRRYTTQSCVTDASQAKMSVFSSQSRQKNCSASSITQNADGSWTSVSTCSFGNGPAHTTHARVSGDFSTNLSIVISTEGSGRPDMVMTMTRVGDCAPGMKGGDVIMPGGMKMNVLDGTMSGVPGR